MAGPSRVRRPAVSQQPAIAVARASARGGRAAMTLGAHLEVAAQVGCRAASAAWLRWRWASVSDGGATWPGASSTLRAGTGQLAISRCFRLPRRDRRARPGLHPAEAVVARQGGDAALDDEVRRPRHGPKRPPQPGRHRARRPDPGRARRAPWARSACRPGWRRPRATRAAAWEAVAGATAPERQRVVSTTGMPIAMASAPPRAGRGRCCRRRWPRPRCPRRPAESGRAAGPVLATTAVSRTIGSSAALRDGRQEAPTCRARRVEPDAARRRRAQRPVVGRLEGVVGACVRT